MPESTGIALPAADPRAEAWETLRGALARPQLEGATRCAVRLYAELRDRENLESNTVLIAYGGGKDSSYMLAFVRLVQLVIHRIYGRTFRMRVATNRHAGMPRAVMENIDRVYRALGLYGDPDCELLVIDGDLVSPFDVELPQSPDVVRRNRTDILMTGHRTAGDARPTFCNACNLSMVNSFGIAAGHGAGVDLIVTGDSRREQRDYYLWITRLARRFGLQPPPELRTGFPGFLRSLNQIAQAYFTDIHGREAAGTVAEHAVTDDVPAGLQFFSIYDDTGYASGDHWELLTGTLGFVFDDLAFSFTESDCGNPGLMAHLRALKTEHCFGRPYAEGLDEYVEFAVSLMRQKEFPPQLIELASGRYEGAAAARRMRAAMQAYAEDAYGLTEEHLVTMVHAPFAGKAANLETYLRAEQPDLLGSAERIRSLLAGEIDEPADRELAARLEHISGLTIAQLRVLYASSLRTPSAAPDGGELIDAILDGDPHKKIIYTRHEAAGDLVPELLSGR
jgi:hypothetical protein